MTRIQRAALPPSSYTEKEWDRQVVEISELYGWDYTYHVFAPRMSPWGWPDRVFIRRRDRRIVFAELKSGTGVASPEQLGLLELLLDVSGGGSTEARRGASGAVHSAASLLPPPHGFARVDVELWRPGDIDRVMEVLR